MKIVVTEPLGLEETALRLLAKAYLTAEDELICHDRRAVDDAEKSTWVSDADVLVIANEPLSEAVLSEAKKLKLISVAFTGVDHVPIEVCRERGIVVANSSGYATRAVAELVFGMVIALYRDLAQADQGVRAGGTKAGLVARELAGKTFGVVGLGAIGRQVAGIALAFGCDVLGWNRSPRRIEGVRQVELEQLLRESDIVSLHLPLTEETRGLIDADRLALMKPEAILINTARGAIVDSSALASALDRGIIAAAGIDVFDEEPPLPPSEPLLDAKHTLLTPHLGFMTDEAMFRRAHIALANIQAWRDGHPQNVMTNTNEEGR